MSATAVAPAPRARSTVKDIQEVFNAMSKERDEPSNVQTTGTLRPVDGGYEQEIVSRSQPRPRYAHGDHVETVTKRTVRTVAGPTEESRDPFSLVLSNDRSPAASVPAPRSNVFEGINSTPPDARTVADASPPAVQPTAQHPAVVIGEAYQGPRPGAASTAKSMYVPLPSTTAPRSATTSQSPSLSNRDPYYPGQWKRVPASPTGRRPPSPTPSDASTGTTTTTILRTNPRGRSTQVKHLNFGGTDTRVIEPSRLSPLRVEQQYAPVKYLSRRELERLRAEKSAAQQALPRMVRRSSVPRLDDLMPHDTVTFAPRVASRSGSRSSSAAQRRVTAEEYAFHNQAPLPTDPFLADSSSPAPRTVSMPRQHPQQQQQYYASPVATQSSRGVGYGDDFGSPRSSASSASAFSPSQSRAGSVGARSTGGRPVVTASMLPNDGPSLQTFVQHICTARGIRSPPPPPAFGVDAFKLLNYGTYLIKYGRTGHPHERWLTLRLMEDEFGRVQPYLVWSLHHESTCIKDRLNCVHLMDVVPGAVGPNFERHLLGPSDIRGPHVGDKPTVLATDFAVRFIFQSTTHQRTVDVLARDDQTFRCWLLVMRYIVEVNASANGTQPVDVESLPPESVRSSTAPSRH